MRLLAVLMLFLLSLTADAQTSVHRYNKVIFQPPYGGTTIDVQILDSTNYKTGAFWQNRTTGIGRWAYTIDSVFTRNDSIFFRRGPVTTGYPLGTSGGSTFDTTHIYNALSTKVGYGEMGAILAPFMFIEDTAILSAQLVQIRAALPTKLPIADTAAMLDPYQRKPFSAVLTDGATITWNYAATQAPEVTIAGNRTLSITNLPTTPYIVSYGCLTVIQDATGGRDLYPPANSRGVNGMGLSTGNPFPLDKTGGAKNIVCFEWKQSENIIYWTVGKGAN